VISPLTKLEIGIDYELVIFNHFRNAGKDVHLVDVKWILFQRELNHKTPFQLVAEKVFLFKSRCIMRCIIVV
jgi:hypothetical protein